LRTSLAEPVYTLDAVIVVVSEIFDKLSENLQNQGFVFEAHEHSTNAKRPGSELRIQFAMDPRCQTFPSRAEECEVLGLPVRVARLDDVVRGKLWAYRDPRRRLSKRKKDELDLIRLAERYPSLRSLYLPELLVELGEG